MTNSTVKSPDETMTTSRIEAFSDAVMAIAITLLILEIRAPVNVPPGHLVDALLDLWPSYLAFVTSFATIGMIWVNHHRVFSLIKRADEVLITLNLLLLLIVTWIPFPTMLLARYLQGPDQQIAAVVYSGTFLLIAVLYNVLLHYAVRKGHVEAQHRSHPISRQYAYGPSLYAVMLLVGISNATACLFLSTVLAIFFTLPPRLWIKRPRRVLQVKAHP